jgi:hypothetical protein
LRARLIGDFLIDRPKLYINLKHVRKEVQSKVPFKEKGWQEALESIYPLKITPPLIIAFILIKPQ